MMTVKLGDDIIIWYLRRLMEQNSMDQRKG